MRKIEKRISAILLGAGRSKRMGRDKLMLPWRGKTVFEHCLDTLLQSELEEVNVVLSGQSEAIRDRVNGFSASLGRRIKPVQNPCPGRGMSASIRRGLRNLAPGTQGVLIALGDQPLLKERTINALIRAFTAGEGKIIVPFYAGRKGNPVLFDRCYIGELLKLSGDVGGRSVIESHPEKIVRVRTRSEAVVRDIDTWEEYKKLKAQSSKLKAQSSKLKAQSSKLKAIGRTVR